jgi:hypothetical protein
MVGLSANRWSTVVPSSKRQRTTRTRRFSGKRSTPLLGSALA